MADNPDTGSLPADSQVRRAAETFDRSYGDLLRSLHATFNGSPRRLGEAVGLMFSLEVRLAGSWRCRSHRVVRRPPVPRSSRRSA